MRRRSENAPWWRRGRVVAVVVVGGGVMVGLAMPSAFREEPESRPTVVWTTAQSGRLVSAPQVSFTGVMWRDYHGVLLPYAPDDGPRETGGDLALGFARTPRGALLAAIH